jgi:hypothetical protein
MRRFISLTLVIMMAIASFATVGYCEVNNWGNTDTMALLNKVVPGYLLHSGFAFGGVASTASATTVIPTSYSIVKYANSAAVGQVCTLANGTAGQTLTISLTARTGSNTLVITPATKTGFATITLDAALESVTLQYLDSTVGWIFIGGTGTLA